MPNRVAKFLNSIYDSKRRQFLGRDGAGWGKLGIFYFFFYLGLAGFFCSMLAVFMALTPRDYPRYYAESSIMRSRSNPLTPGSFHHTAMYETTAHCSRLGLGFRPHPSAENNIISVDKNSNLDQPNIYLKNLEQYLNIYYPQVSDYETAEITKFTILNPGDCTPAKYFGFGLGKPCVLVKMNKIVGFQPEPGYPPEDSKAFQSSGCQPSSAAILINCYGEYAADVDNIGNITYISENEENDKCGSLDTKWFPYKGKENRRDVYQAPYVWVQFQNPKPNVLINVICRAFGNNIYFEKRTYRGFTRFQIYVKDEEKNPSPTHHDTL